MTHLVTSAPTYGCLDEGEREPCQSRVHTLSIYLDGLHSDAHITVMTRSVESKKQDSPIGAHASQSAQQPLQVKSKKAKTSQSDVYALLKCPNGLSVWRVRSGTPQSGFMHSQSA